MKKLAIFLIVLGLAANFSIAWGEEIAVENFYRTCIDKRIEKCESQAKLAEACSSANILCDCKIASNQAIYYRENREELVAEMMKEEVSPNPYAIEHFLIRAYFKTAPSRSAICLR